MTIQLDTIGRILEGDDVSHFIKVIFDKETTGGYYIFQSEKKEFPENKTFDSWVETKEDLEGYFDESNWKVDWVS